MKGRDKPYKVSDGGGLFILVRPSGRKFWKFSYRFSGKQGTISLGEYPYLTLVKARDLRDEAKKLIFNGVNPIQKKHEDKLRRKNLTKFETVFKEWFDIKKDDWVQGHRDRLESRMERFIFPHFKHIDISEITPRMAIQVLKQIESKGKLHTVKRVRQDCARVFRYAVGMGYSEKNPFGDLPLDIFKTAKTKHFSSIKDPKKVAKLLMDIEKYSGSFDIAFALKILPHIFLRPAELAGMTWDEVDFDNNQIRIKAERTKRHREHIVPMSKQVKSYLKTLYMANKDKDFVFCSPTRNGSINPESIRRAIRNMGYSNEEMTSHGFRHMASTLLNELGCRPDFIELQLSHREVNAVRATYNKVENLDGRSIMMQDWSDYLDKLKNNISS